MCRMKQIADISKEASPPHYKIPGTTIQLIDVIEAKMSRDEWRRFCWGSALQYAYRVLDKGEPIKDCEKAIVYLTWLKDSYDA